LALFCQRGVSTAAGMTVQTWMPVPSNSWRMAAEKPRTANFEAAYALT
jgi:hypothetical protein